MTMFLFCVPYRLFWKCLFNKVFEIMNMPFELFLHVHKSGVYEHRLTLSDKIHAFSYTAA